MHTSPEDRHCSVARSLDIVGDRWSPLIIRDVALGVSRFDAMQRDLGISRKVLTQRLQALIDHEVLEKVAYSEHPPRFDYRLTEKGNDLTMVVLALQQFGDKWLVGEEGPPLLWRHLGCGELSSPVVCCDRCGEQVAPGDAVPVKGPGFREEDGPGLSAAIDALHALVE
ncbi:winged helix-turn-helix transcriptional regulator [Nocardioides jejuensis]|uniref:Transcriptional regulator n=1 Tax=Nocardioides jejuensis TaxID=2502782 RepID=A0A4R1CC68_9ACTN|nr:helix-turn-helix domain-containing protein [Nocardioides jejuensis]TCJ28321.1 transcriptional regulator [Nocardioides jejuensis]